MQQILVASQSPGGFVKTHISKPLFSGPGMVDVEWGQRIYICHMFPVNADALGLGHTLGTLPTVWHPL